MIISLSELLAAGDFSGCTGESLLMRLDTIEDIIRAYTHNNFQNTAIRIEAPVTDGIIEGQCSYLRMGDTIEIGESITNDGIYTVTDVTASGIAVMEELRDCPHNLITKVEYPKAIKAGVVNLMLWERDNRKKVGIKSETLSRHSVTYYDQDKSNQVMGYPASLMGFLKPYRKPGF